MASSYSPTPSSAQNPLHEDDQSEIPAGFKRENWCGDLDCKITHYDKKISKALKIKQLVEQETKVQVAIDAMQKMINSMEKEGKAGQKEPGALGGNHGVTQGESQASEREVDALRKETGDLVKESEDLENVSTTLTEQNEALDDTILRGSTKVSARVLPFVSLIEVYEEVRYLAKQLKESESRQAALRQQLASFASPE